MSAPLQGVRVYVDVRSSDGKANYSSCVRQQLELLGAEVQSTISSSCTHVVFKDGKVNTRIQCNKLGLLLVNVLWVEKCRETDSKCDESKFPVTEEQVDTPAHLRKTRTRYRSLQPASCIASNKKSSRVKKSKPSSTLANNAVSDSPGPLEPVILKHNDRIKKKLQWPPDHSDVCSEVELAAHEEIDLDMKKTDKRKGKRKLKRSSVFDQSVNSSSQNGVNKTTSATDLFVISKDSAKREDTNDSKEDSQFSNYDASQHFERTDYSVTNIISQLDATIDRDPVNDFDAILYSESDDDMFNSPTKSRRTCQLTNSQKNVMDRTFDFDEVDREVEPKGRKKPSKHKVCGGRKEVKTAKDLKPKSAEENVASVMNSPTKMLTFNSNFSEDSDIVTNIEAEAQESGNDEISALNRIKSPDVVPKRHQKKQKPSITKDVSGRKLARAKTRPSVRNSFSKKLQQAMLEEQDNDNVISADEPETLLTPVNYDEPSGPADVQLTETAAKVNVVQAPEITSTSDSISKPRRMSKRVRHSSSKLTDPDFITDQSALNPSRSHDRDDLKLSDKKLTNSEKKEQYPVSHNALIDVQDDSISTAGRKSTENSSTRRSSRARKANPKYHSHASQHSTIPEKVPSNSSSTEGNNDYLPEVSENCVTTSRKSVESKSTSGKSEDCVRAVQRRSGRERKSNQPTSKKSLPSKHESSANELLSDKENKRSTNIISENDNSSSRRSTSKFDDGISATRRSGRQRKSNPRYSSDTLSSTNSKKPSNLDLSLLIEQSDKDVESHDNSVSEYSTTETPVVKKAIPKREKKAPVVTTTTDTEDSATERSDKKFPSKRRKARKPVNSGVEQAPLVVRRKSENAAPAENTRVICTTCCHRDDQAMVRTTAKSFSATISESVVRDTTHVVMGTCKRTINLLKAIIHGAYVVSLSWVTDSISKDSWQKEAKYQFTTDFPILKMKGETRRRIASSLFVDLGLIFVDKDTSPPQADLIDLIVLCGGKVTKSRTRSRYCIGGAAQDKSHISLSEQWVLDSITHLKLQDTNKFLLFPYRSPSPEF